MEFPCNILTDLSLHRMWQRHGKVHEGFIGHRDMVTLRTHHLVAKFTTNAINASTKFTLLMIAITTTQKDFSRGVPVSLICNFTSYIIEENHLGTMDSFTIIVNLPY